MRIDADREFIIAGSLERRTPFSPGGAAKNEHASRYLIWNNALNAKKRD